MPIAPSLRVTVVGAGALGSVYGARLARFGGCEVAVVGRTAAPPATRRLERVEDGEVIEWDLPARTTTAARDTDVIIVFVRSEQLGDPVIRAAVGTAPVVVMTPLMPADHDRLATSLPRRVVPAMPSVVAYENEAGVIRYWLPVAATTLVDERSPSGAEVELSARLGRAGIRAKIADGVLARNVATTVSFIPLAMALDVAGSIDALLSDDALLSLAMRAAREGRELGRAVGKAEVWASTLLRFVGPRLLPLGVKLARSRAPEAVAYVEQHFGRKLHAQHVAMAAEMVGLASQKGTSHAALRELLARLQAR
jgi:ketopantoate reductase